MMSGGRDNKCKSAVASSLFDVLSFYCVYFKRDLAEKYIVVLALVAYFGA